MYFDWAPYVPVAARQAKARKEVEKLKKRGHPVAPVVIEGRAITKTFWGKAWCENLERYSDYSNRLPRGRTYVRNGSVLDLQIEPGIVTALVSGSKIYTLRIEIAPLPKAKWKALCADCAGAIDSLVELLQGRFSKGVMERICRKDQGLFPSPTEIRLSCSCPDWASMCKHVAAVLYGIGARLDSQPELLFRLRQVDGGELVTQAAAGLPLAKKAPAKGKVLEGEDLAELFGLDLDGKTEKPAEARQTPKPRQPSSKAAPKKTTRKSTAKDTAKARPATSRAKTAKDSGDRPKSRKAAKAAATKKPAKAPRSRKGTLR